AGDNQIRLNILGHKGAGHNSYLAYWLNTGLVGMVLYFSAFLYTFFKASKNTNIAMPVLYTVRFSATCESWLTSSLNPYCILLFTGLAIMTHEEFNDEPK